MATVVSVHEIEKTMISLGWTSVSVSDVVDGLSKASIPASGLMAYLSAAAAKPQGFDDSTIVGLAPTDATRITTFLKGKGAVVI